MGPSWTGSVTKGPRVGPPGARDPGLRRLGPWTSSQEVSEGPRGLQHPGGAHSQAGRPDGWIPGNLGSSCSPRRNSLEVEDWISREGSGPLARDGAALSGDVLLRRSLPSRPRRPQCRDPLRASGEQGPMLSGTQSPLPSGMGCFASGSPGQQEAKYRGPQLCSWATVPLESAPTRVPPQVGGVAESRGPEARCLSWFNRCQGASLASGCSAVGESLSLSLLTGEPGSWPEGAAKKARMSAALPGAYPPPPSMDSSFCRSRGCSDLQ